MIYSIMVFYDFIKINHDQAANSCLVYLLSPTARLESEISIFVSDSGNWTCRGCGERFFLYLQHLRMELAAGKLG